MKCQKIINFVITHQINHLSIGQKKWIEISDDVCATYNTNTQIK